MELENVIKKLEFKNDINKLSEEELLQKYTSDREKGLYFLHEFGNLFIRRNYYPVVIYHEYDKVEKVVEAIKEKYAKGNDFERLADRILNKLLRHLICFFVH